MDRNNMSTPPRSAWTEARITDIISQKAQDVKAIHRDYVSFVVDSVKPAERRIKSGRDMFAGLDHSPVPADQPKNDNMLKIPHSHHFKNKFVRGNVHQSYYEPVLIKSNKPRGPSYRFHHKEVSRNVLTPNTMLKFVPVIRDLQPGEDHAYNLWLRGLERMDASCGFQPLGSREDRVVRTTRQERALMLAPYLADWLDELAIPRCNRSTLFRYMLSSATGPDISPRQKSVIDEHIDDDHEALHPRDAEIAAMFTQAFDNIFANSSLSREKRVKLRDILLLDTTVIDAVEARPAKDALPTRYIDSHALMGCLICFSNSCEHGEYGQGNAKRIFSIDINGNAQIRDIFNVTQAARDKAFQDGTEIAPCPRNCSDSPHDSESRSTRVWTAEEDLCLRSVYAATESSARLRSRPSCLVAELLNRSCGDVRRRGQSLQLNWQSEKGADIPRARTLPWYDRHRKMLMSDWQDHTLTHDPKSRATTDPCSHDGPCTAANECECVAYNVLCEKYCRCTAECCSYKFTGCACSGSGKTCMQRQKEGRPCICVQLNRECDPSLCGSCGVAERVHPDSKWDQDIMQSGCQNCVLQRGVGKMVMPGQSQLDGCGYGLFAMEEIEPQEFVIEYGGELIMHDEGVRREARRGEAFEEGSVTSYVFSLLDSEGTWVDAAVYGNLSRYINHAEDDYNLEPKVVFVAGEYRIRFSATRNIRAGDELFFNYGGSFPNLTKKMIKDQDEQTGTAEAAEAEKPAKSTKKRRRSAYDTDPMDSQTSKQARTSARKEAPRPSPADFDGFVESAAKGRSRGKTGRRNKMKDISTFEPTLSDSWDEPSDEEVTQEVPLKRHKPKKAAKKQRQKRRPLAAEADAPEAPPARATSNDVIVIEDSDEEMSGVGPVPSRLAAGAAPVANQQADTTASPSPLPRRRGRPPKSRIIVSSTESDGQGDSEAPSGQQFVPPTEEASTHTARIQSPLKEQVRVAGSASASDHEGDQRPRTATSTATTPTTKFVMNTRHRRRDEESSPPPSAGSLRSNTSEATNTSRSARHRRMPARYRDSEDL